MTVGGCYPHVHDHVRLHILVDHALQHVRRMLDLSSLLLRPLLSLQHMQCHTGWIVGKADFCGRGVGISCAVSRVPGAANASRG